MNPPKKEKNSRVLKFRKDRGGQAHDSQFLDQESDILLGRFADIYVLPRILTIIYESLPYLEQKLRRDHLSDFNSSNNIFEPASP